MKKPVILAIDDQLFICEAIKTLLRTKYDIHAFTSGKNAIEFLADNPVDLVLLDYDMPGMTGYEVLLAIRDEGLHGDKPVIFLTADNNERMKMEMLERGASDYICKPLMPNLIHACIQKHIVTA